ncbi:MAG TPA: hypothetical protein VE954_33995 [Oligoflexus sp.]|uniref:hypothetical protein n=1 Tax=Oligoflexus sp. TaxID=1971216 RepID=UPI002D3E8895|nr:hypothetical protein [Oligoflexus sp.]HYX38140.1 hypothetical protein [Oligoflexus sp.]
MDTKRPWNNKLLQSLIAFWATLIGSLIYFDMPSELRNVSHTDQTWLDELTWMDPRLQQEIAVSPVTVVKGPFRHNYDINFRITNLLPKTRCFVKLDLRLKGVLLPSIVYARSRLMRLGRTETATCLRPGETGFVLTSKLSMTKFTGIELHSIASSDVDDEPVPVNDVRVLSQTLEGSHIKVVLKNEALAEGFASVGFSQWVITSDEKIIGSGHLSSDSVQDKKFVRLHETVEIKTRSHMKGPLPENAKLHIILGSME